MITTSSARLMRLEDYGIAEGNPADLVAIDAASPSEAVATIAPPLWGLKKGRLSFKRARPQLFAP
jgi:cytosine deaminase